MALATVASPARWRRPLMVTRYFLTSYRRTWLGTAVVTFVGPILYLVALGVGLGSLIHRGHAVASLGGVSYLAFVAPALVATTAMETATTEASYPIMGCLKWNRVYLAMLATPLTVADVLAGHLLWITARVVVAAGAFLAIVAAFGGVRSPLAVLALPAAVLTGTAFATPMAAFAIRQETDGIFAVVFRFAIIPMFLFSGSFFPVSELPLGLRILADATPLEHGVSLCRALALGRVGWAAAGDVAYLVAASVAGLGLAARSFDRKLRV